MSRKPTFVILVLSLLVLALTVSTVKPTTAADTKFPKGGTVNVNTSPQGNWPGPDFNPYHLSDRDGTRAFIYEPLVVFNPPDGGKPTWWLATDAKYSDDLKSLTFTLRKGVKWSDGQPFTADDVVFSAQLVQKFPALDTGGIWTGAGIDKVSKVDDNTVKFDLKTVYTQADTLIGQFLPVPKHVWEKVDDPVKYLNEKPVATGPFSEVTFSPQVYTMCRNPNYWQEGKPYIDCIRFPAFSGNDSVNNALINGELDWAGNFVADITKTFVAKDPANNHYYFWPEGARPVLLYMNTTKAPFSDVKFRQALSMAINREGIVDNAYGEGYPAGAYNPTGLASIRYKDWISQTVLDKAKESGIGTYSPDKAKAALDAAGYKVGSDNFRMTPDGKPIAFKIQTVNGWTDWTNAAQIIAQNFQDIGLNVSIETPEFGAWYDALHSVKYDASMGWATYVRTPWDYYFHQMSTSLMTKSADGKLTVQDQLWHGWTSPETDKLLNDFTQTTDLAKQKEIVNQLQTAYVQNVPSIPLMPNWNWYEWSTKRFDGFPTQENYYAQGSPWDTQGGALITALTIHCKDDKMCGQK